MLAMRIWWCEKHETSGYGEGCFDELVMAGPDAYRSGTCRMVEMRLVPLDARVFAPEEVAKWRFCPRCGRPNIDQPREVGVDRCTPSNCDAWVHESTFNHTTRQWDPVASGASE